MALAQPRSPSPSPTPLFRVKIWSPPGPWGPILATNKYVIESTFPTNLDVRFNVAIGGSPVKFIWINHSSCALPHASLVRKLRLYVISESHAYGTRSALMHQKWNIKSDPIISFETPSFTISFNIKTLRLRTRTLFTAPLGEFCTLNSVTALIHKQTGTIEEDLHSPRNSQTLSFVQ